MKTPYLTRAATFGLSLAAVVGIVALPAAVFALTALISGMSAAETVAALAEQYRERDPNLLLTGLVGLFPVLLLGAVLWLHRIFRGSAERRAALALGGFVPIAAVLLWANIAYWPDYLPDRVQPGFPHGLELVTGPGLYAPAGMLLGLLVAAIVSRRRG